MEATVGRIVQYRLSAADAEAINRRRVPFTDSASAAHDHSGAQVHVGNTAYEGDVLPMVICRVWVPAASGHVGVNGQVFLDGNDTLWVTSREEGAVAGTWQWPERV